LKNAVHPLEGLHETLILGECCHPCGKARFFVAKSLKIDFALADFILREV
jgi:hypothetical protein